ncbi:hypothetical protein [Thalassospira alkalitolerans]|uniref:hypothetical protein n=1 Tax=Thalassospira alkalitolerans TaxID=1293890 RepID=UPI0030ECC92B|tara:strand:- start:41939 stop:42766 length:828 start_codon:yes stop_codon:yes gene_type:complete
MAYADRISDLARTLAQYPTNVTITGAKIDIRTKAQLDSLTAQISSNEALAHEGDALIAAASGKDAKALSQRIANAAPQITELLKAFAAQDTERLKTLSVVSKNKFNGASTNRLQAEKRFADEVSQLLTTEASTVAALPTASCGPKPQPTPSPSPAPVPVPSLDDVIASLPGYLQITIPDAVAGYDADSLAIASNASGDAAIKLGVKTPDGINDYATVQFTGGPDITNQPWATAILKDTGLGTIDDRVAILNNALQAQLSIADAMNDGSSSEPTSR